MKFTKPFFTVQYAIFIFILLTNHISAQQIQQFSRYYDYNKKETNEKLRAHYLYLYEYTDSICRRTEYYIKEQSVKAVGFFSDTSCKIKIDEYVSYYPNKKLESKGVYVHNKKEGLWLSYYENGNKKDSTVFKNNNPIGISYTWFENGNISIQREMDRDGKGNGKEISFWENGKVDFEGIWENGKRNNLWNYHHVNGNKSAEIFYLNNIISSYKCFDENGIEEKYCDSSKIRKKLPELIDGTPLFKYIIKALNKNTNWQSRDLPIEERIFFVWVSFTVSIDGKIKDITLEHGAVESLDKTSIKIFKDLKELKPTVEFNRRYENRYTERMEFRSGNNRF